MATINKICSYRNADKNLVMLVHLLYNDSMEKPVIKLLKTKLSKYKKNLGPAHKQLPAKRRVETKPLWM